MASRSGLCDNDLLTHQPRGCSSGHWPSTFLYIVYISNGSGMASAEIYVFALHVSCATRKRGKNRNCMEMRSLLYAGCLK